MNNNLGSRRCCYINKDGTTGMQGPDGAYGPIGEIGVTGSTGSTGPTGATGICYRGQKGPIGPAGLRGGSTGNTGPVGPKGNTGPLEQGKNISFSFTIDSPAFYSNEFKELTTLASSVIENSVFLNRNYSILFEINENWTDAGAQFYLELDNGSTTYRSYVFNPNNNSYLVLYTNGTNMFGSGNDLIQLPFSSTKYSVKLYQKTTLGSAIQIGGKKVNFSITFIKLS